MNILYLNHNVIWKSTFHRCFLLARELALLGHTTTIVTNSPTARLRFRSYTKEGVAIIETPDLLWGSLRTGWDPINCLRRYIYLRNYEFDIIHAFDTRPTVIIPALLYRIRHRETPLIIDWADWWGRGGAITMRSNKLLNALFAPVETFFEESFRSFADYTTVTSVKLRQRAINLGINPHKISVLYSGADTRTIYPVNQMMARKILNIPPHSHVCIFPGFVLYDIDVILKAFRKIYKHDSRALLILSGQYPHSLEASYKDLLKGDAIRYMGTVTREQLRTCLSAANIGLLPLKNNIANQARFPIKFGDFLAAGIPFVTNGVGDVGKLVKKYGLAVICKYDPSDIAKKVLSVFQKPTRFRLITQRARRFAENQFSWGVVAKQVLQIYENSLH